MITRMNALNDLTAEVRFRERMRGYDYEEVDSYVKNVSRAATHAKEQIADLQQRLARLESQATSDEGVTEIRETLLRTLVLAQRTADSAVAEARAESKSITSSAQDRASKTVTEAEAAANERLRSAEERAGRMLAEGEESCQIIIAEAKRIAAAELATDRARAREEIQALEATKVELETAVAEIQTRLDHERTQLRRLSVAFQSFVEKFEPMADIEGSTDWSEAGVDVSSVSEASGAQTTEATDDTEPAAQNIQAGDETSTEVAEPAAQNIQAGDETSAEVAEPADAGPPGEAALEFLPEPEKTLAETMAENIVAADAVPDLPVIGWDEAIEEDPSADVYVEEPAAATSPADHSESGRAGIQSMPEEPAGSRHVGEFESSPVPAMSLADNSPELFDMDAEEEDDEFIEQLRQVISGDAPLPDTDAAMAAFFDHDESVSSGNGAPDRSGRLGRGA